MRLIDFIRNLFKKKPVKVRVKNEWDYILKRTFENHHGTFGTFADKQHDPLCNTVEPEWRNNQVGISCIPKGIYAVKKHFGKKYKDVWILQDVPGRKNIVIHWGNVEDDTEGCILVGSGFGVVKGKKAVLRSRDTIKKLRKVLPDEFVLRIE